MKKIMKKAVGIFLVLSMICGMLPLGILASEEEVYISISFDGQYISDKNGEAVAYTAVPMTELEKVDLAEYGLSDYLYDADGDGDYEITALHLYIYTHESICGLNWSDVGVSGGAGSIFFEYGLFGFADSNLRYDYNGAYPAVGGWGVTADQIVLSAGDFIDIASYTSWSFYWDSATGFHYFADEEGNITHNYTSEDAAPVKIKLVRSYSDLFNGGSAYADEMGYEVFYGSSIGNAECSVYTDDTGCAEITFPSAGEWYVWCNGGYGMENPMDIVSSPAMAKVSVNAPSPDPAEPITVNVTIADKGEIVMVNEEITVTDLDASGDFNIDEVLYAAHENSFEGGAASGYASENTAYGLSIKALWGDTSGNYGYWLNDASCWSLEDKVNAGDSLVAFVYQNTEVWDSYSRFTVDGYTALSEKAFEVILEKAGYDASWNTVFAPHKGAELKIYNSDFTEAAQDRYSVTDNEDGSYSIMVKNIGEYYIAAYDNTTPIVPALVKLNVTLNSDLVYADGVEVLINGIGTVTKDSKNAIDTARTAYDALSEDQKALVENYDILVQAEIAFDELSTAVAAADEVEALIDAIGTVDAYSGAKIKTARTAYDNLTELEKAQVENYNILTDAEGSLNKLYAELSRSDYLSIFNDTNKYLGSLGTPYVGSVGGEWMVIALTRGGMPCPEGYYENVVAFVNENINEKGQLHNSKSTENSRVILGLTAAGYDVTNLNGHNLLMGLTDMEYLKKQGINGPIWALIAMDSRDYDLPVNEAAADPASRIKIVSYILEKQLEDGGWALSGTTADPDMTAMAIQALAPYYNRDSSVKAAVDKALETLGAIQHDNGSFGSVDGSNSESCAQVIVALTTLGIDPEKDERFIKNGISVVDALCSFAVENGGFTHTPTGTLNGMATEQGQYALAAYYRFLNGKTSLYDMSDVEIKADAPTANGGGDQNTNTGTGNNVTGNNKPATGTTKVPQTSDSSAIGSYMIVMLISVLTIAIVLKPKRKTENR